MTSFYIIPLAFILGFALARAATCTVAATGRLIIAGKSDWMVGLFVVAAWSAIVLFGVQNYTNIGINLPYDIFLSWQMILASMIMGVGAFLNRACFVGTISKIGTGDFAYLLTFAGLALVLWLGRLPLWDDVIFIDQQKNPLFDDRIRMVFLFLFALTAGYSLLQIIKHKKRAMFALLTVGISAALIFGTTDHWGYTSVVDNLVSGSGLSTGMALELSVLALFGGAMLSSWLKDRFKPRFASKTMAAMNFTGGFLMGLGAIAVPGGNDLLLLWVIPGMALYGFVAYGVMIATIAAIMMVMRRKDMQMSGLN